MQSFLDTSTFARDMAMVLQDLADETTKCNTPIKASCNLLLGEDLEYDGCSLHCLKILFIA